MKKFICVFLIAALMLTAAAFADRAFLRDMWLEWGGDMLGESESEGLPTDGKIDGVRIAKMTMDDINGFGQEKPQNARQLLARMEPFDSEGHPGGLLYGAIDIRTADVKLTGSEMFTNLWDCYDESGELTDCYTVRYAVYRFTVDDGAQEYDILVNEQSVDRGPVARSVIALPRPEIPDESPYENWLDYYIAQDMGILQVVNCKEWVSMRAAPDKSSECLRRVFLDDKVIFLGFDGDFTLCMDNGVKGYIASDYLAPYEWD